MGIVVTPESFEREVVQRSHQVPVVVDFWAPWCGPCRVLGPVLEELERQADGAWVLVKINTQEHPSLAQRFGIQGIPAVKGFRDGEEVDAFVGALPKAAVATWLEGLAPSEADLAVRAARAVLPADPEAALASLRAALGHDDRHGEALLLAAELTTDAAEARAWLERLPPRLTPEQQARKSRRLLSLEAAGVSETALRERLASDPEDLDARWDLAHRRASHEAYGEALEHLMHIVRRDRSYRDDGARKAMLGVFDVIGRSAESDRWRDELMRELTR